MGSALNIRSFLNMDKPSEQFVAALSKLTQKAEDETSLVDELYEAVDLLDSSETVSEVFPAIFRLFESYPAADFGTPGPLVHLIEKSFPGGYEELLLVSLERRPVHQTVWMANRLLNSDDIDGRLRGRLQSALKKAAEHSAADERARQVAAQFIEHQRI